MKMNARNRNPKLEKPAVAGGAGLCPAVFETVESTPEKVFPSVDREEKTDQCKKRRSRKYCLLSVAKRKGLYFTP